MDLSEPGDLQVGSGLCVGCTSGTLVNNGQIDIYHQAIPRLQLSATQGGLEDWALDNSYGEFRIKGSLSEYSVVRIQDDAPEDSIFVEGSTGDVGFGTSLPEDDLHVFDGGIASILLDGSGSKFSANSDERGFFVFDDSNFRQPFAIEPNSPTDSLFVENTGDVGVGVGLQHE